jgi:hypothetical protein
MQPPTPDSPTTPQTGQGGGAPDSHDGHMCSECAAKMGAAQRTEQYVYAIGRLDVRFPSIGIEREYQQRERALADLPQQPRNARILAVLEKNPHLALRVTYVLQIGGTPVFALTPGSGSLKDAFFKALGNAHDTNHSAVVIGRTGGFTNPGATGGLLLSTVSVDQLYVFSASEWAENLAKTSAHVLQSRKVDAGHFRTVSQGIFRDVIAMPENMGVSDGHRALNYLLVQHPGMFLAAAERSGHVLDRIETRLMQTVAGRRHVAVILNFLERTTGVPERVYTTVDVTEEWPFVASAEGVQPLGFAPFLENTMFASA